MPTKVTKIDSPLLERLTPERLEYARTSLHLAANPLMHEIADHIDAQQAEVDRLTVERDAYKATADDLSQRDADWRAEVDRLRALLCEAREALILFARGAGAHYHGESCRYCRARGLLAKLAQEADRG